MLEGWRGWSSRVRELALCIVVLGFDLLIPYSWILIRPSQCRQHTHTHTHKPVYNFLNGPLLMYVPGFHGDTWINWLILMEDGSLRLTRQPSAKTTLIIRSSLKSSFSRFCCFGAHVSGDLKCSGSEFGGCVVRVSGGGGGGGRSHIELINNAKRMKQSVELSLYISHSPPLSA